MAPHLVIRHELEDTTCGCGRPMQRIGEDIAEKLDYEPGVFTVERYARGRGACTCCGKVVQAPVAPHVINNGLPTAGRLAEVLVASYLDHRPLYCQKAIFERVGHAIARSTLAKWVGERGVQLLPLVDALGAELLRHGVLHADETPVAMLKPGHGKTHRAHLWSYCRTQFNPVKVVFFDFTETRGGQHGAASSACLGRRESAHRGAAVARSWLFRGRSVAQDHRRPFAVAALRTPSPRAPWRHGSATKRPPRGHTSSGAGCFNRCVSL